MGGWGCRKEVKYILGQKCESEDKLETSAENILSFNLLTTTGNSIYN